MKIRSSLLAIGILFCPGSLFGAFNRVLSCSCTAEAVLSVPASTGIDIVVFNLDGTPADPPEITWDTGKITPGQSEWVCAQQYLAVTGAFSAGGVMQIYTDNCSPDADPRFYIVAPTSCNPAGLLDESTRSKPLPLCWRITRAPLPSPAIQSRMKGSAMQLFDPETGPDFPCYLWMKDRSTPGNPYRPSETSFVDGEDYVRVWEEYRGCQIAEGTWSPAGTTNYLYLGADFRNAAIPETYRAGALVIEMFSE